MAGLVEYLRVFGHTARQPRRKNQQYEGLKSRFVTKRTYNSRCVMSAFGGKSFCPFGGNRR